MCNFYCRIVHRTPWKLINLNEIFSLVDIQEHTVAAQLYVSIDLMKDAIDTFILAEDWTKARKLAKELEPAYESYIESRYKDRLLTDGNIEQLADVGE